MTDQKIISIGPLAAHVVRRLEKYGGVVQLPDDSRVDVLQALDDSTVMLIARGSVYIDGEIFDRAPNLLAVARTGVGYDSVSITDATQRGVPVLYTPGAMTRQVAEQTLAFLLAATKKLNRWRQSLLQGDWNARYTTWSLDVEGSTLGIIGYGRIGRQVRRLCRPFEMKVLADDPYIDHSAYSADQVEFVGLEELLESSDIITLHVPLNDETRGLINRDNVGLIRPGSILINTARGGVIQSLDLLYDELETGRFEAVALDVFPEEPPDTSHALFSHPRVILTGHVAARTPLSQERILASMLAEVTAVLEGRRPNPENVVNPEVLGPEGGG